MRSPRGRTASYSSRSASARFSSNPPADRAFAPWYMAWNERWVRGSSTSRSNSAAASRQRSCFAKSSPRL